MDSIISQLPLYSPSLKTTEPFEWAPVLKHYLRTVYGSDREYDSQCREIQKLRNEATCNQNDDSFREILLRYFGQLEYLALHFEFNEIGSEIEFTWYDCFQGTAITQNSLAFEKASILFNLGCSVANSVIHKDRSDPQEAKYMIHNLNCASGIFNQIVENFLFAPSADLTKDMCGAISTLMLAQSQEIFLYCAIKQAKKWSLIAGICAQASQLYSQILEKKGVEELFDLQDYNISITIQNKTKFFLSLAHFYAAKSDSEQKKPGLAVANITKSISIFNHVHSKSMFPTYSNILDEASATINKENNFIYHEYVPSEIPSIPKLKAVEPVPFDKLYSEDERKKIVGSDKFMKIIPVSLIELSSLWSEEKAKLLRSESDRCAKEDGNIDSILSFFALPSSLEKIRNVINRGKSQSQKYPDISSQIDTHSNWTAKVELAVEKMKSSRALISRSKALIKEEREESENMKREYGKMWTQESSVDAARHLWRRIEDFEFRSTRVERDLVELQKQLSTLSPSVYTLKEFSDRITPSLIQTKHSANLIDSDEPEIADKAQDYNNLLIVIDQVEELLDKLQLVKKERSKTLNLIRKRINEENDLTPSLLSAKKSNLDMEKSFGKEIEKFRPLRLRLSASINQQNNFIDELKVLMKNLLSNSMIQEDIHDLPIYEEWSQTGVTAYDEVSSNLKKIVFRTEIALKEQKALQAIAEESYQNVEEFIESRRNEGAEILEYIENATNLSQKTSELKL